MEKTKMYKTTICNFYYRKNGNCGRDQVHKSLSWSQRK